MGRMVSNSASSAVAAEAWPTIGRLGIPGRLDPHDPAGALIFETSDGGLRGDAIARFYGSDMDRLDWLTDYLMFDEVLTGEEDDEPDFSIAPDADEDDHYDKKALTTTATDSGWDIT